MNRLATDFRHALRRITNSPGHAATVILLLGLGIGANAALFAVANAVLFRPLPYGRPERLVVTLHDGESPVSPADYFDYRKGLKCFDGMAAAQAWSGTLLRGGRPEQVPGLRISSNMLPLLQVKPMIGRSFTPEEEHAGASNVLLLSYQLWQQKFRADRRAVGRIVEIDRVPYTVVGVMPREFRFAPFWATRAQMWSPLDLDKRVDDRGGRSLRVFGRLRDGVTVERAQAEMDMLAKRLAELYPSTNAKLGISVIPLHDKVVHSVRPTLLALIGTVGFVFFIACATVSNLLLERGVARRKETALRAALGAGQGDLIRINLLETLLLAVLGGVAGVTFGNWSIQFLAQMLPPGSIPRVSEVAFDQVAFWFSVALTLVSALIAGLIPALQAAKVGLNDHLKSGDWGNSSRGSAGALKQILVGAEVALCLVLLAGAGLMMRTMLTLQSVDAGFNPHRLLTAKIALSGTSFDTDGRRSGLFREMQNRLAAVPGIESVSAINHLPIAGDAWTLNYVVNGRPRSSDGDQPSAVYRVVMPGYFQTMQIRLLQGRALNDHDNSASSPVAVINEAMAKRRWPGESAIGKTILYGPSKEDSVQWKTIVGVVRNTRQSDWTSPINDEIYLSYYQRPDSMGLSYLTFVMRTRTDADKLLAQQVQQVGSFEGNLSVSEFVSMDQVISDELWRQRLVTTLVGAFACLSLLLVVVGVYGIISYSMRERTREIGIRMALGADARRVLGLALREGMQPVLYGAAVGLFSALVLTQYLQSLLFGVSPVDPVSFAVAIAAMVAVSVGANLIPALRAARLNPIAALRNE